jgi:Skp family chaperone for outer membrane proteins
MRSLQFQSRCGGWKSFVTSLQGLLVAAGILSLPSLTHAQLPSAELHSIHPPVLSAGTSTEIKLTGVNLDLLTGLQFSKPGIKAEPILVPATEYRKQPGQDGTRFRLTIPADQKPGFVEVRAAGYFGLTPTRPVLIIPASETTIADSAGTAHHGIATAPELPREAYAWGTTDTNQTDWWKVTVKKGERLLVHCHAERIDSQADASLKLVDGRGFELETSRDAIGRDPMIDFTSPMDGHYWVGVHDFFYNGGANFTYLLQVSAKPWIDAVFPPAITQEGSNPDLTLLGRNLPGTKPGESLSVKAGPPAPPAENRFDWNSPASALLASFPFQHAGSNTVDVGIASDPVIVAPADDAIPAVTPPCEIAAKFEKDGDSDTFRFVAKKGETYWIEIVGDRLNGKVDPYLIAEKVTKKDDGSAVFTKVREADDDNGYGGATFPDRTLDGFMSLTADQDGEYRIQVINHFATGSPTHIYRLAIRKARPDFDLIAITERPYLDQRQAFPAVPLLRKGGTFPVRVLVKRKDGLTGPITISAEGLPPGVSCPPVTVAEKETTVRLVFAATPEAPAWHGTVSLIGTGKIGDREIKRTARTGTLVVGNGDYNNVRLRTRLESTTALSVSKVETTPARIEAANGGKFSVVMGQKLEIPVKVLSRNGVKGNLAITPVGLHGLVKPPVINIAEKDEEGKLSLSFTDQKNVFTPEVGTWNFVLQATGVASYARIPESVEQAKEEQKSIEALFKKYTDAASQAKAGLETSRKALEAAKKNLSTASPDAKASLEKSVSDAQASFDQAEKLFQAAEAKRVESEKEKAAAAQRVANATKLAAAKDLKFATWSLPVTVEVKPAPEKPETK